MERIYQNSIIKIKEEIEEEKKFLCSLNMDNEKDKGYDEFIKNILNIKSFPYINTEYGSLLEESFAELSEAERTQVKFQLQRLLREYDEALENYINKSKELDIKEAFFYDDWKQLDKKEIFKNIKGGQYGEMLLNQILLNNGFEKILSKLSMEWGRLSPTGIDVTYINLDTKEMVLAETKFYHSHKDAVKAVNNDINKIINGLKFDEELNEWGRKCIQMPSRVQKWYLDLLRREKVVVKSTIRNELKRIFVVGFVIANKNRRTKQHLILEEFNYDNTEYISCLISVSIESKENFIESCKKQVEDLLGRISI